MERGSIVTRASAWPAVVLLSTFLAWGCGSQATAPTQPPISGGFNITCPASVFVGQTLPCVAVVGTTFVFAIWSSSDPSVASFGNIGSLTGKSAGQVQVTATYLGSSLSAQVGVQAQDIVQADASATGGGSFRVGSTVSMTLIGFYGVASADSGLLNMVITDQGGGVVSATPLQVVPRGGNSFVITATFVIPAGTTQMCRAAVLQIGSVTLTATVPAALFPCVLVTQ
jgi:hypothetical protein